MGDCRLYRNGPFRDAAALCVRMDGRESRDRGVFGGQRVDLGAHEAVVYPVSRVHGGGVYCVFRGVPELLRRQGGEHPAGPCLDSGAFLHADGNVRQAP